MLIEKIAGDLADLFERAAAQDAPIHPVVGEDPVEFAETFFRNYSDGQWISKLRDPWLSAIERGINKERARLVTAAEGAGAGDRRTRS